ncbi:MAG: hypothetical protein WCJ37_01170 [Syntrophus sp. (in: bacteria)]
MEVKMNPDDKAKIAALFAETPKIASRITKRAVDRTMGTVKTTVSRVARETLNVYKRDLDQNIGVLKYDVAKASGAVTIVGASLPVFDFKPVQLLSGVQVRIKKKGPSKLIPGAFIAKMKTGHEGVFLREWHGPKKPGSITLKKQWKKMPEKYRLPAHELFTTSLPEAVGDKMPMDQILADAGDNLHKNLERELNYELSKL